MKTRNLNKVFIFIMSTKMLRPQSALESKKYLERNVITLLICKFRLKRHGMRIRDVNEIQSTLWNKCA